ncbi:T9SS type A sorting domain-containing protein [Flavobacterium sp. J372]|uniref:T9SS type A sorting domain-containing protein n=1 Tax=Flavobacterium sp. J372 TaxID=2898436 RepID=UPI002150B7C5|nr:T9SS type A sorting domain-containing protein [Flavobacterium sp. J372]MCR5861589.1 T9SS type A sorting domain-containing protein [Flavobacterium sp. J372]
MPNLKSIVCDNNIISQLEVGHLPNLESVSCKQNPVTSLDFSNCPKFRYAGFGGNITGPHLNYLNVKNGYGVINFAQNSVSAPLYICADEGEQAFVSTYFANQPVTVSTYCSFTPGGNYNTIAGAFTFDGDSNGCTSNDALAQNVRIGISDGIQTGATITNNSCNYNFYTQVGNFTLTPQFENNWFAVTPATATVNFTDNNNNTAIQNFCISPNGVHPDVEVILLPVISAQPGFDARYQIVFKNKGNQTLSGNVFLGYDETVLDYVALGSTAPTSTANGQLTWAYSNLLPFESRTLNVVLNLNGPMETPPVNLDDVLNYIVSITPATGDETPANNTFTLNQVVIGSYDPNDITCLEGDIVHPDKIGQYLHYNINFENTGTAPATFIVVKDVINAQQYDINSLQMLHSSHNVETRINGNKVEFFFDEINLAPLGKGNVVFKMKTKPTVAINSTVMNKAEIFFDYNWPIVTNEAETTFAVLSAGDFAVDNSVSIYPNPAITNVTIKASSAITSVQLYDIQGRLLIATNNTILDVSDRASGIYFVKVMTEKGMKIEKLVRK